MGSQDEFSYLSDLSEEIDQKLLDWMITHEIPALNLIAIVLARLTWVSKQANCREDFLELLKAPSQILEHEEDNKDYLH